MQEMNTMYSLEFSFVGYILLMFDNHYVKQFYKRIRGAKSLRKNNGLSRVSLPTSVHCTNIETFIWEFHETCGSEHLLVYSTSRIASQCISRLLITVRLSLCTKTCSKSMTIS